MNRSNFYSFCAIGLLAICSAANADDFLHAEQIVHFEKAVVCPTESLALKARSYLQKGEMTKLRALMDPDLEDSCSNLVNNNLNFKILHVGDGVIEVAREYEPFVSTGNWIPSGFAHNGAFPSAWTYGLLNGVTKLSISLDQGPAARAEIYRRTSIILTKKGGVNLSEALGRLPSEVIPRYEESTIGAESTKKGMVDEGALQADLKISVEIWASKSINIDGCDLGSLATIEFWKRGETYIPRSKAANWLVNGVCA